MRSVAREAGPSFLPLTTYVEREKNGIILIHQPVDYLGALIFGSLMYLVAVRTKSLMACVVMHGVANLLMGLYAMHFGKYGLW